MSRLDALKERLRGTLLTSFNRALLENDLPVIKFVVEENNLLNTSHLLADAMNRGASAEIKEYLLSKLTSISNYLLETVISELDINLLKRVLDKVPDFNPNVGLLNNEHINILPLEQVLITTNLDEESEPLFDLFIDLGADPNLIDYKKVGEIIQNEQGVDNKERERLIEIIKERVAAAVKRRQEKVKKQTEIIEKDTDLLTDISRMVADML